MQRTRLLLLAAALAICGLAMLLPQNAEHPMQESWDPAATTMGNWDVASDQGPSTALITGWDFDTESAIGVNSVQTAEAYPTAFREATAATYYLTVAPSPLPCGDQRAEDCNNSGATPAHSPFNHNRLTPDDAEEVINTPVDPALAVRSMEDGEARIDDEEDGTNFTHSPMDDGTEGVNTAHPFAAGNSSDMGAQDNPGPEVPNTAHPSATALMMLGTPSAVV